MAAMAFVLRALPYFLVATFAARVVPAEETPRDPKAAEALFDEARHLLDVGEFERACKLLEESQRLDPGGGTVLNLALCKEKQGKVASAWTFFREAESAAIRDGQVSRSEFARKHLAALTPRLPKLTFRRSEADVMVRLDGVVLRDAAWDIAIPVDPGPHRVEAEARESAPPSARKPWASDFTISEHEYRTIQVPALELDSAPSTHRPVARRIMPASYAFGAVSVASFAAMAVTGVLALAANAKANASCSEYRAFCTDPDSANLSNRARTLAWISTGALAVGAASAVTAWFWPRGTSDGTSTSVRPSLGPAGGGVSVAGSF